MIMTNLRIKHHMGVLEYLKGLPSSEQKRFINGASSELLKTISELCLNLLKGTIKVSETDLKNLKKYKKQIIFLSERKHSSDKRRKLCSQRGGFLGSLIGIVLPAVITAIITATQKR